MLWRRQGPTIPSTGESPQDYPESRLPAAPWRPDALPSFRVNTRSSRWPAAPVCYDNRHAGPDPEAITSFISRWEKSGGSEKANYALFLTELCDHILHVPHPEPAGPDNAKNRYVFERAVTHKEADGSTATGYLDLYKAGCFVLETKQGTYLKAIEAGTLLDFIPSSGASGPASQKSGHGKRGTAAFDKVLTRAFNQARKYITSLPATEGRPPFLIVCDVGHTIDLYAEFSGPGGQYERFPDPVSHRIWTDPHSLDPAKMRA